MGSHLGERLHNVKRVSIFLYKWLAGMCRGFIQNTPSLEFFWNPLPVRRGQTLPHPKSAVAIFFVFRNFS